MAQKILVIGGVALGPKAACRCKRLMPDAEITLVDENLFISYGGCGIPYYVSGEVNNLDDLRATPYHTVRDPEFFRTMKGITVRNQTRALAIDRAAKTLLVRNVVTGEEEKLPYDKLVLATGATPRMPPVEGHDLKNVLTLTRLEAADAIRKANSQLLFSPTIWARWPPTTARPTACPSTPPKRSSGWRARTAPCARSSPTSASCPPSW